MSCIDVMDELYKCAYRIWNKKGFSIVSLKRTFICSKLRAKVFVPIMLCVKTSTAALVHVSLRDTLIYNHN